MEVPVISRRVVRFRPVGRLAALLGTSYFLMATSVPYEPYQTCYHPYQSVAFHVTGTCGPEGDVTMTSLADDCAISVEGGGNVGLPTAGRFAYSNGQTASLTANAWTLSGYLPEGANLPGGADAGFFGVESDAQPNADVGTSRDGPGPDTQVPTVSHATLIERECENSPPSPLSVTCRDGTSTSSCQAMLTVRK
jgi:hypothetical protein